MNVQTFSFLPLLALAGASALFAFAFQGQRPQRMEALVGALCLTTLATLFYWIKPCPGEVSKRHCLIGWICCKLKKNLNCGCTCGHRECFSCQRVCSSRKHGSPALSCKRASAMSPVNEETNLLRPSLMGLREPAAASPSTLSLQSALSACSPKIESGKSHSKDVYFVIQLTLKTLVLTF